MDGRAPPVVVVAAEEVQAPAPERPRTHSRRGDEDGPGMLSSAAAAVTRVLSSLGFVGTPQPAAAATSPAPGDWSLDLTDADLFGDSHSGSVSAAPATNSSSAAADHHGLGGGKFLDTYALDKARAMMEAHGVWAHCEQQGYTDLTLAFDLSNPFAHKTTLHGTHPRLPAPVLLIELVMRRMHTVAQLRGETPDNRGPGQTLFLAAVTAWSAARLDLSVVDWLRLQNPAAPFPDARARLPEQEYPGLGCLGQVSRMMGAAAAARHRDALMNAPAHFHNAYLYGVKSGFLFGNPDVEGAFRTLCADVAADIAARGLAAVTNAILYGRLAHAATGLPVKWVPEDQLLPLSARTRAYFEGEPYRRLCAAGTVVGGGVFALRWEADLPDPQPEPISVLRAVQRHLAPPA
jgi:hypothetical protein